MKEEIAWLGPSGLILLMLALLPGAQIKPTASLVPQPQGSPQQAAPEQPIPFSHKKHSAFHVSCDYCHSTMPDGVTISFPETSKCMMCHTSMAKDKPAIQKLAGYHQAGEKVPWKQVYSVPGYVFWSHQTHLDAKVQCTSCHGDVSQMDAMRKVTNVTTMAGCVECHKQKNATTGCLSCHEMQNSQWLQPLSPHFPRQVPTPRG